VDVLSSRILLRPGDLDRSRRFYRDVLGLAVDREFGPPDDPGVVFFLGSGFLEVSGYAASPAGRSVMIWIQVRDVRSEHAGWLRPEFRSSGHLQRSPGGLSRCGSRTPMASGSSWSRYPPITLCAVTRDRPQRRDDVTYA
jgi:catechol 2,3-dioxygenase-like lactoylglutathione lyase family enzyme